MENKINIAEILKDCPRGMELDCTIFEGTVILESVNIKDDFPIIIRLSNGNLDYFTKIGGFTHDNLAKCVIFPKGKTTWEGFQKPFKDGDIIYTKHKLGTEFVSIFQIEYERDICIYWGINLSTNKLMGSLHEGKSFQIFIEKDKVKEQRLATEEEKQKLFQVIKDKGYKWNAETKTSEKLPKFKVGNKVRHKNNHNVCFTITNIGEDSYICGAKTAFWISDQDNYELVPNKFDINTLKPFDSRVLVRDGNTEKWKSSFWGFYDIDHTMNYPYECCGSSFAQCIPHEGNEHLLGKTDDCDKYYKTWEE